eukprot:jgi/Botrbrau1/1031/Bobra.0076s0004.1
MTEEDMEKRNPYTILELEGYGCTNDEIKKAYRRLSLIKHPDKQPDNPKAAEEFLVLRWAYDLLMDTAARSAWDSLQNCFAALSSQHTAFAPELFPSFLLRCFPPFALCLVSLFLLNCLSFASLFDPFARWFGSIGCWGLWGAEAKEAAARRKTGHTEKRRKMMEELRQRESASETGKREEDLARAQLQVELARLRRKHEYERARQEFDSMAARSKPGSGKAAPAPPSSAIPSAPPGPPKVSLLPTPMTEHLMRTLKVSWDVRDGAYTSGDLREIFGHHGDVQDVIIRQVIPSWREPVWGISVL